MTSTVGSVARLEVVPPGDVAVVHVPDAGERAAWWRDARRWSSWLDSAIPIPGTGKRVGWDGIVGFVPLVGDITGLALSAIVIARGILLGARRWTVARMVVVAGVDALVGLIPFVGGVFDFVFKANERNLRTLEQHALDRHRSERESRRVVLLTLALTTAVSAFLFLGAVALVVWLVAQL